MPTFVNHVHALFFLLQGLTDATYIDSMITWALYGLLICPQCFSLENGTKPNDAALQLLQVALGQGFVVPIFRDKVRHFGGIVGLLCEHIVLVA